jgi:hypothetical protein
MLFYSAKDLDAASFFIPLNDKNKTRKSNGRDKYMTTGTDAPAYACCREE